MNRDPFLKVENASKSFGGVKAVANVSFEISKGEALGIIGPNGSGKTTLINLITGFVKPDAGRFYFKGMDITGLPPHKIADLGIARSFQIVKPFSHLPVFKNLFIPLNSPRGKKVSGAKFGSKDITAIGLLGEVGFEPFSPILFKTAGTLPHGYIKRLELARCLALKPELLILDEIFAGLSAAEAASLISLLEKLRTEGITLILVEHRLKELFRLVDRVIALNFGEKIAEGSPKDILKDEKVKEAYLGGVRER